MSLAHGIPAETLIEMLGHADEAWPRRRWALLDVREAGEAEQGHIPSATPLPRRLLEFRIQDLVPNSDTCLVIYDSGGDTAYGFDRRAELAVQTLSRLGYGTVRRLEGGLAGWQRIGPVEKGVNVPCKAFGEQVLSAENIEYVTPEALSHLLAASDQVAVCDVRTPEEFAHHHLPGALATPGFELALHLPDITREYGHVVVNCAGRTRSIIAAATAQLLGMTNVAALENGTMGWRLAGLEVESGPGQARALPQPRDQSEIVPRAQTLAESVGVASLSPEGLSHQLGGNQGDLPYVFDVRALEDFRKGHIPRSVALPGGQAVQRADDFAAVPGLPVVFVDDGDARAFLAAYWYRRMGFPRVSVLNGGVSGWNKAGFELFTGDGRGIVASVDRARSAARLVLADSLRQRLANQPGVLEVVHVGTSRAFAAGHLPNAAWLPRGWLEAGISNIAGFDDTVVLVDRDERQALLAAETLAELGYRSVEVLSGGTGAWTKAGGLLETGLDGTKQLPPDIVEPPYQKGLEAMRAYLEWEICLDAAQGRTVERGAFGDTKSSG